MGFLRRLLGNDGASVPDWAPFDTAKEYEAFIDAVSTDLRRRDMTVEVGDGVILARQPGADEPHQLGLANLSQLCHAADPGDWSRIIASHFTSLLSMQGRDLDALAADYDQVKPILRVRLMPDESMGGVELPQSVSRPVAPGILAVLVFDFPEFDGDGRCRPPRRLAGRCRWGLRGGARQPGVRADAPARERGCR